MWNEQTRTFVAVSELARARGKRSGSSVNTGAAASGTKLRGALALGAVALAGAGLLSASVPALADVTVGNEPAVSGSSIEFSGGAGSINFADGGTISGLADGSIDQNGTNAVTTGQLWTTNNALATVTTSVTGLSSTVQGHTTQINANTGLISANTTNIATNTGNIATHTTQIGNLQTASDASVRYDNASTKDVITLGGDSGTRITNLANGDISSTSTDAVTGQQIHNLFIDTGAGGVRYFHANSEQDDSTAVGDQSIAIGPNSVATGDNSFAAGQGASTAATAGGAIALGQDADAGSTIDGEGAIAIGRGSEAGRSGSIALGDGAKGTDTDATAVGAGAQASSVNATALGASGLASGGGSIAIGGATASAGNALAAGTGAYAATAGSIALGVNAGIGTQGNAAGDRTNHIAVGTNAGQNVAGNQTTAIGYGAGSNVTGDDNVALGTEAGRGLQGNNNISIGVNANDGAGIRAQAIAIGDGTSAGSDSVAMGSGAAAEGSETLALGKDSYAGENGVAVGAHATAEGSNIALGRNSAARETDLLGSGYLTGSVAPGSAVSVGNSNPGEAFQRRITNVADGAQGYDAVNVRQLQGAQQSVSNLVGGNVTVEPNGSFGGYVIELTDTGGATHQYTTVAEAINAVSSGAISVLPGNAVIYNSNGTVTVAEGVIGTDAVNVAQLEQAVAENGLKYFSANTTVAANRDNDGATGTNAMAIGPAAVASGDSSLALGYAARVNAGAHNGVAIGHDVSARALDSTAIGNRSHVYDQAGVAIGREAVSRGQNSIVMGTGAEADPKSDSTVDNAIVIGTVAEATANDGIAIGQSALASEERAVAQGYDAHATAEDAQAFGTRSRASGVSSQASGTDARASGSNSIASGTDSRAYAADGIAIGTGAVTGIANPPLGEDRRNINGIAIGNTALADYENAMALGVEANARANSATAIGDGADAEALNALAVGTDARVTGVSASAFGRGAEATALNATALGQGAQAGHTGSVALGSGAVTALPVGTSSSIIDKVTYNYAGTNPVATVSVGTETEKRTITNMAAGRVSSTSTDAINGSQLFQTNTAVTVLGNNLDTAGSSVAAALGGTSAYDPSTHTVTAGLSVQGNNYTNVQDALTYVGQGWNVSAQGGASGNVAPGGLVDLSNTDGNINIARSGTNLTFALDDEINVGTSINVGAPDNRTTINGGNVTTNNLTVGGVTRLGDQFVVNADNSVTYNGSEIANQNDGLSFAGNTGGTIAKTLGDTTPLTVSGQLAAGEASTGANLRVDSDGNQLNLVMARNLTDLDSITINNGGPVINGGGINMRGNKITNLAAGTDDTDAVNVSQLNDVADTVNAGWNVSADGGTAAKVAPGGLVDFGNDDGNIVVARNGTNLSFELADDVTIGNSLTVGDTIVNNGGVTTNNLTVTGETRLGDNFLVNNAGNVTYNGSEIANQNDGLSFAGNTGSAIDKTLGDTTPLTISGELASTEAVTGENLRVDSDGNQLNLVMARNLTDLDSITINNGGPVINSGGINMNNNRITNLAPGVDGTDAVNIDQLEAVDVVANAGWNLSVGGEGAVAGNNVAPGGVVNFDNTDGNIEITRNNGTDLEFNLNKDIDLGTDGSLTTGNTLVNNDGLAVDDGAGNRTETTVAGTTVTNAEGDTTKVGAGSISVADAAGNETAIGGTQVVVGGANPITISGDTGDITGLSNRDLNAADFGTMGRAATEEQLQIVNDTANAGWNVSASGAGSTAANIGPNGNVMFSSDSNITVTQTGIDDDGIINVVLNEDIDLGPDGSVTTGNSVLDNTGLTINDTTAGTLTSIGSGAIALADSTGNITTIDPTSVTVGGSFPIAISGNTGIISGLQNQTVNYADFADGSGRAATEEQLAPISNFVALNNDGTFSYNGQNHPTLQAALDSMHWNVEAPAPDNSGGGSGGSGGTGGTGGGTGGGGSGDNSTPINNGNTVGFVAGDNIVISKTDRPNGAGADIKVAMADDISVNSITAVQVNAGKVNADRIEINNGGPVIDAKGIDMAGKPITNVAAGVNETDAVNVGQLQQAAGNLQNQVNNLSSDLRRQDKRLSGGVAAAMATAALPQAYLPGKTMMSMAGGTWNSESGMAIGFSGISDNGHWVYKLSGNATSRGDYGGAVGVGYQW
ncbi:Autotransporter adhesin [Pusillimonas sp. T7-7]|nr:Autotransporter adhesin [Pusillimonas sp. T7-7]